MQGIILAAGQGERLRPITLTRSKAMAPVVGKPITERVMETLVANGMDDIVLVISPDDDEIIHHFQQEPELGAFVEKPTAEQAPSNIYSLPLYCFSSRILDYQANVRPSPRGEYELQDAILMLIDHDERVRGVTISSKLALTDAEDLLAINQHYLAISGDLVPFAPRSVGRYAKLLPPLCIEPDTAIGTHCTIGPNVYVERACQIGDWVTAQDAVILRDPTVPDGATLAGQAIALADD